MAPIRLIEAALDKWFDFVHELKVAPRCGACEKEWIEAGEGIGPHALAVAALGDVFIPVGLCVTCAAKPAEAAGEAVAARVERQLSIASTQSRGRA